MASYYQATNKTWYTRFRVCENGTIKQKCLSGFPTKKACQKAYDDYMLNVDKSIRIQDKSNLVNFRQLYSYWQRYYINEVKESSYVSYNSIIHNYILPYFGNTSVHKLTTLEVSMWKDKIAQQKFSINYSNKIFSALVLLLNYARKFFGLQNNVAVQVGGFKDKSTIKKEMEFWTPTEFQQFILVADNNYYKTIFLFLYLTGCRKGELQALTWQDIDLVNKVVYINKTYTRKTTTDSTFAITPPKSKNSNRSIHLPTYLVECLQTYKNGLASVCDNDFVFGREVPVHENSIARYMKKWIAKSGVKPIRVHDLRHSHVSFIINASQNTSLSLVYVIANRIGDRVEEVLDTYGHMFPNEQEKVMDNLDTEINTIFS